VVIDKDLAITAARPHNVSSVVADGDDALHLPRALCTGRAKGDELGARTAGEVVQVHASEHPVVGRHHGRAYRVDPVLVRAGVGVGVDGTAGQLDKLRLVLIEWPG